MKKLPMQPLVFDDHGVVRFRENKIVSWLLDAGPFDMNQIACLPGISVEEREQFAQLIGYIVSGYGDLSYVRSEVVQECDIAASKLLESKKK